MSAFAVDRPDPQAARCHGRTLAIIGEFDPTFRPHAATNAAFQHVVAASGLPLAAEWVSSEAITDSLFDLYSAIWVAPGSPYKSLERTLWAIRHARERRIPCLGTCGGFQHIVLEYARNVLGFQDAQHAEYDPYASDVFVSELTCSLAGREMPLQFAADSAVARVYGALAVVEEYYCNFGVHPRRGAFGPSVLRRYPVRASGALDARATASTRGGLPVSGRRPSLKSAPKRRRRHADLDGARRSGAAGSPLRHLDRRRWP